MITKSKKPADQRAVRGIEKLLVVFLYVLASACETTTTEVAPDAAVEVPDASSKPKPKPTPEQEKALSNPLHRAHLDADKPAACRDCHRIEGPEKVRKIHRCLSCHDDHKSAVHRKVANEEARECVTCHDFLAERPNYWACGGCHVEKTLNPDLREHAATAPLIQVHSKEACNTCHLPHGETAFKPSPCRECHEAKPAHHRKAPLKDPKECLECHRAHELVSKMAKPADICVNCHVKNPEATHAKSIPTTATFKGHPDCLNCHGPHKKKGIEDCAKCHEPNQQVVGRQEPKHVCISCHKPHEPTTAVTAKTCVECHDKVQPQHPKDDKKGGAACTGCHSMHPKDGQLKVAADCSTCHEKAKTDQSFHAGANCTTCHKPHQFLRVKEAGFCLTCHDPGAKLDAVLTAQLKGKDLARVKPFEGHSKCLECHKTGSHAPQDAPVACASCHEPEKSTITKGHEKCIDCHKPHEGVVPKTCIDCHAEKTKGFHAEKQRLDCNKCHRPHGPKGPSEPQPCKTCHDKPLPLLHAQPDHQNCKDCHGFHAAAPQQGRATCLKTCHAQQVGHETQTKACTGCHPFGGSGRVE